MTRFRSYYCLLVPALLSVAGAATAQLAPVLPLAADPGRASYAPTAAQRVAQRGTTALPLPFFDDFTTPLEGAPKAQNWLPSGGAFVSNRLALMPLTRGTATLDGLRANGQSYSGGINTSYGLIDSLTSQPIDLGGLTASSQVALSFAWQAGSIAVDAPNGNSSATPVRLELYVKTDVGAWERVWFYVSQRTRTPFRQQVVLLNQAKYLHGNFQFQFVASGNRSNNSDAWGLDYVVLDRGRTRGLADTTFADVATSAGLKGGNPSGGLRSPLRRFAAMPVWQFNAASPPTSELNPRLGINLINLSGALPLLIDVTGTVRERPTSPVLGTWRHSTKLVSGVPRQDSTAIAANQGPVPTTAATKTLRYTVALNTQERTPRTLANDTIFRDVELANYYAYDDGTAENFTQLVAYSTGQAAAFAYQFDLNRPDYVGGLRLYPVFTASDANSRAVTINVWDDASGQPDAQPRATKTAVIPNPLPAGLKYFDITFDQPVPVSGSFYVGYSQPSTGRDLHYGLDQNSRFPARHLWRRDNTGAWDTTNFVLRGASPRGALMMRPVMTNNVTTATASARAAAAFSLYPNPAHGTVTVAGPGFVRATVLDALGRTVWEQPAAQAGQVTLALPHLPTGLFAVRLLLANGQTISQRLLID